jgi:hypothetical protein
LQISFSDVPWRPGRSNDGQPPRPDDDETRRVIAVNSEYVVARGGVEAPSLRF